SGARARLGGALPRALRVAARRRRAAAARGRRRRSVGGARPSAARPCAHPRGGRADAGDLERPGDAEVEAGADAVPQRTLRGEARAVARLARTHGWRSVAVVTSTFHVTRAKMLFRRCYRGELAFVGSRSPWWRLPEDWALETAKLAVQLTRERSC